jgi:hypothetical protein
MWRLMDEWRNKFDLKVVIFNLTLVSGNINMIPQWGSEGFQSMMWKN